MKKKGKRNTKTLDFAKWVFLGIILIAAVFFIIKLTGLSVGGATCTDSDNGTNIYKSGYVSGVNSAGIFYVLNDSCVKSISGGDYITERTCTLKEGSFYSVSININCTYGCANGACLNEASSSDSPIAPPSYSETDVTPTDTNLYCSNSDGGKTPTLNGNLSVYYSNGTLKKYFLESCMIPSDKNFPDLLSPHTKNDSCSGKGCMLEEFYCTGFRGEENQVYAIFNYYCPSGCINGACLNYNDTTCTDTDLGVDYYTKGILNSLYPNAAYGQDYCLGDGKTLREWSCVNGAYTSTNFTCPYSCNTTLGKCLNTSNSITSITKPLVTLTNWTGEGCSSCPNGYVVHNFGAMKKCVVKINQLGAYLRDDGAWSYWGGTNMALCEQKVNAGCSRKCGIGSWRCCIGATIWKWNPVQWRIKNK